MLRLLTFGGLALEPNGSATPRLRPPRLALLAVLAAAGDRGVSRDRLVALFWPDADEEHGRHSLRQALYALKNEAGHDLVLAGASLQLNPGAMTSDIDEFRAALDKGDRRRAAALYRGPFLDGFYLSGSPEFERWVEQERTRIAESVTAVLLDMAGECARAGSHDEAVRCWHQLTALAPLSSRFALGHARALMACGDRAQALAIIRAHESLIRRELEVDADPELRQLEQQLRAQPEWPQPPNVGEASGSSATIAESVVPPLPFTPRGRFSRGRVVLATGTLGLAAILGAWQLQSRDPEPAVTVLERPNTRSTVAARFYDEGLRAYRIRDLAAALRLMQAALREDSTFAMAAYIAAKSGEDPGFERRQLAMRLAERAPERERLTIVADLLSASQEPEALAVVEEAASKYPGEFGIQLALGHARRVAGEWAGSVEALDRALRLAPPVDPQQREECLACESLGELAETYWWWDSVPAVERIARRYLETRPEESLPWSLLALAAARTGDSAVALTHLRKLIATAPPGFGPDHELAVLLTLEQYDQVERRVEALLASAREAESNTGRWMLFIALRNQGRLRDAELLLRTGRIGTSTPVPAVPLRVDHLNEALVALEGGNPHRAAALFDLIREAPHHPGAGQRARWRAWNTLLMATALAAAGDTAAVRSLADTVQSWGNRTLYGRDRKSHHFLRGLLLAAEGKDEAAVRSYQAAVFSWSFGYTRVNYELARALLRLGRPAEAVAALQPALRGSIDASNLYITRTELHELLAQAFDQAGQPDSAAAHYRAVVRAWQRADERFVPRRLAAQTRIQYLVRGSSTAGSRPARIVRQ
jgi:DNA-binding SARP family transcriptional activator